MSILKKIVSLTHMSNPDATDFRGQNALLARLVHMEILTAEQAKEIALKVEKEKGAVPTYLLNNDIIPSDILVQAFSAQFGLPWFDLRHFDLRNAPQGVVSEALVQKYKVLPLARHGKTLSLAVANPNLTEAIDDVKFQTNMVIDPILVEQNILKIMVDKYLGMSDTFMPSPGEGGDAFGVENLDLEIVDENDDDKKDGYGTADVDSDSPTVKFVNKVIVDAIRKGASDLHFEPYEDELRVRFRMDGMLKTMLRTPVKIYARVATRLKVMAQLDIAERRLPQDGRMKVQMSKHRQIDFRVSTCPTMYGEKIVLRVLDGSVASMGIDHLGYEPEQKALYLNALAQPYGMILVTGPTGSGKTVSLYTGLNVLNEEHRNISTAEDPVEIRVKGINQVQMNAKKGLSFSVALRSFLRQDPDVIMVGEIRDLETAEIAIKAAQTGHLVLSTLHTNDAPQAVARMVNMGIAPYNITSSVSLVIAQRLARRLHSCKRPIQLSESVLLRAGFKPEEIPHLSLYEAVGCPECNDGYKGRVGVYQVMPMTEEIQKIVLEHGNAMQIAAVCKNTGIKDLRESGLEKIRQGLTTLEEIERITLG